MTLVANRPGWSLECHNEAPSTGVPSMETNTSVSDFSLPCRASFPNIPGGVLEGGISTRCGGYIVGVHVRCDGGCDFTFLETAQQAAVVSLILHKLRTGVGPPFSNVKRTSCFYRRTCEI